MWPQEEAAHIEDRPSNELQGDLTGPGPALRAQARDVVSHYPSSFPYFSALPSQALPWFLDGIHLQKNLELLYPEQQYTGSASSR